jgi:hypothetical protein
MIYEKIDTLVSEDTPEEETPETPETPETEEGATEETDGEEM